MSKLKIKYFAEDDYHGKLYAEVESYGFAARGSAWFNKKDIYDFTQKLAVYPLQESNPPKLAGGTWAPDSKLHKVELGVALIPYGRKGDLVLDIEISHICYNHQNQQFEQYSKLRFPVEYQSVYNFSQSLVMIIDGVDNETSIVGSD